HTRFSRDWSSDVCSSDLLQGLGSGFCIFQPLPIQAFNLQDFGIVILKYMLPQPALPGFQFTRLNLDKIRHLHLMAIFIFGAIDHLFDIKRNILSPGLEPVTRTTAVVWRTVTRAITAIIHIMTEQT